MAGGLWRKPVELRPCLRLAALELPEDLRHAGSFSLVPERMWPAPLSAQLISWSPDPSYLRM